MFTSPKTTISGIVLILTGIGAFGKIVNDFMTNVPVNYDQVALAVGSIVGGIGLIAGRDNLTTSEDVGIK